MYQECIQKSATFSKNFGIKLKTESFFDDFEYSKGLFCIQCSTQFDDQFQLIEHLKANETCKQLIRPIGLNFCFVCKKNYDSVILDDNLLNFVWLFQVKKAKTHYTNYRNQGVNPHDFSRNLHREWFELIQFPTSREIESLGKLIIFQDIIA